MVINQIRHYWKTNQAKKLSTVSLIYGIIAFLPLVLLDFYYGYGEDGLIRTSNIPGYVTFIILPITIAICAPLFVLSITGLIASLYEKKLTWKTLGIGGTLFLVLILSLVMTKLFAE